MEIVSKPDIRGPEEAAAYMSKLRTILRYLGTCDGNIKRVIKESTVIIKFCVIDKPIEFDRGVLCARSWIKHVAKLRGLWLFLHFNT